MNSCVPKLLSSTTPPQWVLIIDGRFSRGPMPSFQWYSSAKQPPGQRSTGMFSSLSAATTSLRIPRVFGIGELGAHPDALVDAAAEVLGEVAVDVLVDDRARLVGAQDRAGRRRRGRGRRLRAGSGGREQERGDREHGRSC